MRLCHPYLLLAAAVALAGCAGPTLISESDVEEFQALNLAASGIPERTTYVRIARAAVPFRVAVHEAGRGSADRVVVMLHGVLSDSAVWRFIRPPLAGTYHVITVDLPGCGDSDRPDPAILGRSGYAPQMLARYTLAALRERLAANDHGSEAPITLVGHSLGGMIALRMFADPAVRGEYADVLDRVDGLVLFTPVDVAIEKDIPTFRAIAEVSDLEVAIADVTGLLRAKVAASTRDGVVDLRCATREEARRTLDLLRDRSRRRAAQAMIRQAVPVRGSRPHWDRIEPIVHTYRDVDVPCLIVWGGRDELLPVSMGFKLQYHLPDARLHVINRGMHCLPVERPRLCAELVRDFIENGHGGQPTVVWAELDDVTSGARLARAGSTD